MAERPQRRIRTIDAHAAGQALRLVVGGFPRPRGRTMADKRDWLRRRWDRLRRALMREPRGHAGMCGAVLTEPVTPGAHAGLLFMHAGGYTPLSGHGVVAAVTIALERGLLHLADPAAEVVLDTVAGPVTARAERSGGRVTRVSFRNVPAFVLQAGVGVRLRDRQVAVDVAFGGMFYAIADGEALGAAVRPDGLPALRRLGLELCRAADAAVAPVHPRDPGLKGIHGAIVVGAPDGNDADLRSVTIFADARVDRSPSATGTAAAMAVVAAMGMLEPGRPFVHESLAGTRFVGRVEGRTTVGGLPAIVARIAGEAWITGEHEFVIDAEDPLADGLAS